MVFIKKIEMRNFKTFDKRVSLKIERGFTVLTGPNGSGKSNILDAVKFALGELSPKELRGTSISDVISQTSASNPKRSAYVLLQFDNKDRRIPADTDLVSISREFYKNGEGLYRVNGRRVPRKQLLELLSSANIRVSGYNIIPQQSITRMAELTPEERRQVIEDLVGVKVYDEKKESANSQLEKADLNLKIAMAKVGEVKSRIEALERERNRLLKNNFLINEKNRLKSNIISNEIQILENSLLEFRQKYKNENEELEGLKKNRQSLALLKEKTETKQKILHEEIFEKKDSELSKIENSISNLNSKILEMKNVLDFEERNIEVLKRQKEKFENQNNKLDETIKKTTKEIEEINKEKSRLNVAIDEKEDENNNNIEKLKTNRELFKEITDNENYYDTKISKLRMEEIRVKAIINQISTKIGLLKDFSKSEIEIKDKTKDLLQKSEKKIKDLDDVNKENSAKLQTMDNEIKKFGLVINSAKNEILNSINVICGAKTLLLEHEIQKKFIYSDKFPQNMGRSTELAKEEILKPLIYGKFQEFITIDKGYEDTIKKSFKDWMEAIVVEDFGRAMECIDKLNESSTPWDSLNIIPIKSLLQNESEIKVPKLPGILGRVIDFINYDEKIYPAINSVFENTLIAENNRTAFILSLMGFKAVTISGELYMPGGQLKIRNTMNASSRIQIVDGMPEKIGEIHDLILILEQNLDKKINEMKNLSKKLSEHKEKRVEIQTSIKTVKTESNTLNYVFSSNFNLVNDQDEKINHLRTSINNLEQDLAEIIKEKDEISNKISKINHEAKKLEYDFDETDLEKMEGNVESNAIELRELSNRFALLQGKLSTLEFSLKSTEDNIYQNDIQRKEIENEINNSLRRMDEIKNNLTNEEEGLHKLVDKRKNFTSSFHSKRSEYSKVEEELKNFDNELKDTYDQQEFLNTSISELVAKIREKEMKIEYLQNELSDLGEIQHKDMDYELEKDLEPNLRAVEEELARLGAVNQLAIAQYDEQKNNYKQLSYRINELEMEKASILDFINELEDEKTLIFRNAFDKINDSFKDIFSKITSGGIGSLMIENPEKVFDGGVDLMIQFPGKAQLSINSASGGEKSVATVCFILSLQTINPMPFYIFDEI
ncbi:hypothetical protein AC481_03690, partial [miscellaneous Crenarchaeota group archaeon SMTZ-80]